MLCLLLNKILTDIDFGTRSASRKKNFNYEILLSLGVPEIVSLI